MSALVSVVVPVYNLEKYIENCLKSIVAQTYKNLEILCIDDGSTDGSARIIKEFAGTDERIKYFYQRNQGLSATRNEGIRFQLGNIFCLLILMIFCTLKPWRDLCKRLWKKRPIWFAVN